MHITGHVRDRAVGVDAVARYSATSVDIDLYVNLNATLDVVVDDASDGAARGMDLIDEQQHARGTELLEGIVVMLTKIMTRRRHRSRWR